MGREERTDLKSVAYSYIRLSSKQQVKRGDGARRQLEAAELYCKQNNLVLSSKTFRDLGISAYKEVDRPSLSDLHQCITNGMIKTGDVVILEKLDRLSRQGIAKTQAMLQEILSQGVIVVSLMDGLRLDQHSLDDLTLVIRIAIASDIAHKESQAKSIRIQANKDAAKAKAKEGIAIPRKLPFWLSLVDGKYQFNDRLSVLHTIIDMKRNAASFAKIAAHLNSVGIPTANQGGIWNPSTLRDVIANPALYGAHQVRTKVQGKYVPSEIIKDYYPVVISFSEYTELNSKSVQRAAGASETNHISGLVYCAVCGKKMASKSRKNKTRKVTYYYCRYSLLQACTNTKHVRNLHQYIIDNANRLEIKQKATEDKRINEILVELDQIDSRITELSGSLANISSPVATNAIISALSSLEEQKRALLAEQKQSIPISPDAVKTLLTLIDDPKAFNIQLKKVVQSISISPSDHDFTIRVKRHDNHSITFNTGNVFPVSDTKAFKAMLEKLHG
ncbi:recombinase family protein [Aeromonas jandaei]|uniref:recombinase family protein n=1 Tax=Aeromonas jandaei TaxID=650 RepID=UPI003671F2B3